MSDRSQSQLASLEVVCERCAVALDEVGPGALSFRVERCGAHAERELREVVLLTGAEADTGQFEAAGDGAWRARFRFDYMERRLNDLRVRMAFADGSEILAEPDQKDPLAVLQISSAEEAGELVRRRRSRKFGPRHQLVAAHQAYLFGRSVGDASIMAYSLCSVGWRLIELEASKGDRAVRWLLKKSEKVLGMLDKRPRDRDRWMPSLSTMRSQLALSQGDVDAAIVEAERVLRDKGVIERCPISAYNVALNLATCSILGDLLGQPPEDRARWPQVLRETVAHMDIRFGTIREFGVIYNVLFLVARSGYVAEGHQDRRLKPVALDEYLDLVVRVALKPKQRAAVKAAIAARRTAAAA